MVFLRWTGLTINKIILEFQYKLSSKRDVIRLVLNTTIKGQIPVLSFMSNCTKNENDQCLTGLNYKKDFKTIKWYQ